MLKDTLRTVRINKCS